jgi:hypothetical protein
VAYSKAKLKSNGDKASLVSDHSDIENLSDRYLTVLYVSFKHTFINQTSLLGIPN